MIGLVNVLILLYVVTYGSVLKSLGACPRDGSSPSSGTTDPGMLCHRNEVAFVFQDDQCANLGNRPPGRKNAPSREAWDSQGTQRKIVFFWVGPMHAGTG